MKLRLENSVSKLVIAIAIGQILTFSHAQAGQIVVYNGTNASQLQDDPAVPGQMSLFPGTSLLPSASDNTVTVSDAPSGSIFISPARVYGGIAKLGDALNNKVNITGGTIQSHVLGAHAANGDAINNSVEISGGIIKEDVFGAHAANLVSENKVSIIGGQVKGNVIGGRSVNGVTDHNSVTLSNGTIDGSVKSAISFNNNSIKNILKISGGTIGQNAHAGYTENGNAEYNEVFITGGNVGQGIYGGQSLKGAANSNSVSISNATVGTGVYGGRAVLGNADNNTVIVNNDSVIGGWVAGGYTETGDALSNTVNITGGILSDSVFGARSFNGNVTNNSVTISGGSIHGDVTGAYSYKGDANKNTVTISNGTINRSVYGGFSVSGAANGNQVNIIGGHISKDIGAGYAVFGEAKGNSVTVTGGVVDISVLGARSENGDVLDNTVVVSGGSIGNNVTGAYADHGNAINNKVNISNGTVVSPVYGGYSASGGNAIGNIVTVEGGTIQTKVYGGTSRTGYSMDNIVSVSGGDIGGDIIGGYGNAGATDNTINLNGDGMLIAGALYGGLAKDPTVADVFTGNTLNLNSYRGTVDGIYNFENYNWLLPNNIGNGDTVINIAGSEKVDLTNTKHNVAIQSGGYILQAGERIILIGKANGYGTSEKQVRQGSLIAYNATLSDETDDALILSIKKAKTTEESKAYPHGRAAALGIANQGGDLIADYGVRAARSIIQEAKQNNRNNSFIPFIIVNGSSVRYGTGSHIDMDGYNMAAGLATGFEFSNGSVLTLGGFFEYGHGNYDSYNNFVSYGSVHADGKTSYTGGGILFRLDVAGTGLNRVTQLDIDAADGLYIDGSFHGGRNKLDFNSNDLIDDKGATGRYNNKTSYYGLHLGAGYVFNLDEKNAFDLYGRYMYTRVNGNDIMVGSDKLKFTKAESSRIRVGGRYNYTYSEQFKPYVGVAYEHEFKGELGASVYGIEVDKASIRGGTGVLEAGFNWQPLTKTRALSIDVKGQVFVGERSGGAGGVKLKYEF